MRRLAIVVNIASCACVVVVPEAQNIGVDSIGQAVELAHLEWIQSVVADNDVVRRELDAYLDEE